MDIYLFFVFIIVTPYNNHHHYSIFFHFIFACTRLLAGSKTASTVQWCSVQVSAENKSCKFGSTLSYKSWNPYYKGKCINYSIINKLPSRLRSPQLLRLSTQLLTLLPVSIQFPLIVYVTWWEKKKATSSIEEWRTAASMTIWWSCSAVDAEVTRAPTRLAWIGSWTCTAPLSPNPWYGFQSAEITFSFLLCLRVWYFNFSSCLISIHYCRLRKF